MQYLGVCPMALSRVKLAIAAVASSVKMLQLGAHGFRPKERREMAKPGIA